MLCVSCRRALAESCSNVEASACTTPTGKARQSQGVQGGRQVSTAESADKKPLSSFSLASARLFRKGGMKLAVADDRH